jgi:hypothetical protein
MNKLFPVNLRKVNNSTFANDNYSLSTDQAIMARSTNVSATGTCTTTVATIVMYNHGYIVGDTVNLVGTGVFNGAVTVTAVNQDSFNYTVSTTAVTTPVNLTVTVVTIEVNEYVGTEAPVILTVTQTLAALQLAAPVGSTIPCTIVGTKSNAVIVAPSDSLAVPAIFFTGKTVNIRQVTNAITAALTLSRTSTTVTGTSVAHGLSVGQYVTIVATDTSASGTYAIATVPTSDTFTYTTTASGALSSAVTTSFSWEYSKIFQYKEGARNIVYLVNEYYALLVPFTTESYFSTTSSLTTAALTAATTTVTNATALVGQKVIGAKIDTYSGTLSTNGIPVITQAKVTSAGVITFTVYNAHAINALSGTLKVAYTLSN